MVFSFHMAFGILLIALVAGVALFFKAKKYESGFGKFIAVVVILLAVAHLACTGYYGFNFWKKGLYDMPMMSMKQPMMGNRGAMMGNQAAPQNQPAPKQ